jgi:hypothetical protein
MTHVCYIYDILIRTIVDHEIYASAVQERFLASGRGIIIFVYLRP